MDSNFEKSAEEIKAALAQAGLQLKAEVPLLYGVQFLVSDNTVHQASVSVYYGKRGITAVIGGKDSPLRRKLEDIVSRVQAAAPKANEFSARPKPSIGAGFEDQPDFNGECVGTDESGKGDFFGPLVVAGVWINALNAEKLVAGGVKDSKAVPDAQVAPLADLIRSLGRGKFY